MIGFDDYNINNSLYLKPNINGNIQFFTQNEYYKIVRKLKNKNIIIIILLILIIIIILLLISYWIIF